MRVTKCNVCGETEDSCDIIYQIDYDINNNIVLNGHNNSDIHLCELCIQAIQKIKLPQSKKG